jgi:hypothetical protein
MFEPAALAKGPSGLSDWPRPFVFRSSHLDGRTILPGETFYFDFHLFEMDRPAIHHLVSAFERLAREGFGPGRGRAEMRDVFILGEGSQARISDGASMLATDPLPFELSLNPLRERMDRVCVRFVTPTELKSGQQLADRPEFDVLAGRIRDRLSTLRELYDSGPLQIDFRAFGERARQVRMTRCEITSVEVTRRSSRTGQTHGIGGFVGQAEYTGDLREFIPYLRAAQWTGVGRQTVWGKGQIEVAAAAGNG